MLIMTTNHPQKLDAALIRPGRVDHQVAFSNATQSQVEELFQRMYTSDLPRASIPLISTSPFKPPLSPNMLSTPPQTPITEIGEEKRNGGEGLSEEEELAQTARSFAVQVPDDMFSPAEIQGFLLKRKKEPRKAVEEIGEWVEGMMERKRSGRNVA